MKANLQKHTKLSVGASVSYEHDKNWTGEGKNLIKQSINVPAHSVNHALMAVASPNALRGNQLKIT